MSKQQKSKTKNEKKWKMKIKKRQKKPHFSYLSSKSLNL